MKKNKEAFILLSSVSLVSAFNVSATTTNSDSNTNNETLKQELTTYLSEADFINNQEKMEITNSINSFTANDKNSQEYKNIKNLIDRKNLQALNKYITVTYAEILKSLSTDELNSFRQTVNDLNKNTRFGQSLNVLKAVISTYVNSLTLLPHDEKEQIQNELKYKPSSPYGYIYKKSE
ncbi:UNVERIFIED_CONTAM: hypothetical protein O8I53_08115 [Campylobacter lari]